MLSKEDINWLETEFGGTVKWVDGALNGFPPSWKGWAHVVINPLPSPKELKLIAADICHNRYIRIEGGRLKHSSLCLSKEHYITGVINPERIKKCLNKIPDTAYNIAIYSNLEKYGNEYLLFGQPVVITFDPPIDYIRYPGHLHLNTGGQFITKNGIYYMPDTLCYRKDFEELLALPLRERLLETLFEISIWLFRHQIWVETRDWIGDHEPALGGETFCHHLNPLGNCRCGSGIKYHLCCMHKDIVVGANKLPKIDLNSDPKRYFRNCIASWEWRVGKPQLQALELLNKNFKL